MKAATSTNVFAKKLVLPLNLSVRVAGGFYALYGVAALFKLWQYSESSQASATNLFAGLILGSFVLFGLGLGLWTETLTIDPIARMYSFRKGVWPFTRNIEGPLSDARSVVIMRGASVLEDGDTGQIKASPYLAAQIEWLDGRQPLQLFSLREESGLFNRESASDRILGRASKVATYLNCQLDDKSSH